MAVLVIGITGRIEQSARLPSTSVISMSQSYARAVALAGGAPVVTVPHAQEGAIRAVFERLDGLLLSGGGDVLPALYGEDDSGLLWSVDEQRDRTELTLAKWALSERLPLLAICRGTQVLNIAAGGILVQDIATGVPDSLTHSTIAAHPPDWIAHSVRLAEGSRLARLFGTGEIGVNSAHHQAVKTLGSGFVVVARVPDGVIEGIESLDHPLCIGVQWHPETMLETQPRMLRLFGALVEWAWARRG